MRLYARYRCFRLPNLNGCSRKLRVTVSWLRFFQCFKLAFFAGFASGLFTAIFMFFICSFVFSEFLHDYLIRYPEGF